MLKATTIDPNKRKSRITCYSCGLSYTSRDYDLLYKSQKLAYFRYKPLNYTRQRVFCHNCFYKCTVEEMGVLNQVDVEMVTLEGSVIVTFYK